MGNHEAVLRHGRTLRVQPRPEPRAYRVEPCREHGLRPAGELFEAFDHAGGVKHHPPGSRAHVREAEDLATAETRLHFGDHGEQFAVGGEEFLERLVFDSYNFV